jgi:hypothetical protein
MYDLILDTKIVFAHSTKLKYVVYMHALCMKRPRYDLLNAHGLNSIEAHQCAINIPIESRSPFHINHFYMPKHVQYIEYKSMQENKNLSGLSEFHIMESTFRKIGHVHL